jgi:L-Ala-D/L-Glu epimerase
MTHPYNAPLSMSARVERFAYKQPFHITGYTFTECAVLVVTLREGDRIGRGEGLGVYYRQDTPDNMLGQVEALRETIERGVTREELLQLLPAGGARNALDCALWDLEAKRRGRSVWQLADVPESQPLLTTFTVGADEPEVMAEEARRLIHARAIKLKLTDDPRNAERVRAVRAARPDVWLMVDANQGFSRDSFAEALPAFVAARVAVVEQPFPVGHEDWLDGLNCPIPIAADESVQDYEDLQSVIGRVRIINIKLDKCGGLTQALRLARAARELGMELMVGNMGGSSWSMAPASVLGSLCAVVDLDGPIYTVADRTPAVIYRDGRIVCPAAVWGGPMSATA